MDGDFFVEYSHLDDLQRDFIKNKFDQNMLIIGKAGTGKSLIALHKLSRVPSNKTGTIVVYTKVLKQYFQEGVKVLQLGDNIKICYKDGGYPDRSDYVFVDECQDFTKEEVDDLISRGNISYFFGDDGQTIMVFPKRVPQSLQDTADALGVRPMELFKNYRLTKENAELAEYITNRHDIASHCFRKGQKPILFTAPNPVAQIDYMINTIKNQNLTRVGILLPYNTIMDANKSYDGTDYMSVEFVRNYMQKRGMPVDYKIHDDMHLDFENNFPKLICWHSAKGLQFNDVFILFCEYNYYEDRRNQIYVAITRAWSRLYLGFSGQINTNFFPDVNSSIYTPLSSVSNI